MYKSVRKLIAILLLLALPLQGLSAVLMPFHCLTDEQDEAATVSADQHHDSVAHEHDGKSPAVAQHHGDASSNDTGHLCCNHVYTGVPSVAVLAAPDTLFVSIDQISIVLPPFFPERLLRPPRT